MHDVYIPFSMNENERPNVLTRDVLCFVCSVDNCREAMERAQDKLDIPMVLEPEYLASPYLDDLSGMTYLSYFMKENSPGYFATLRWVQQQIPEQRIRNFTVIARRVVRLVSTPP